jgi:hypothetical protein
MDHHPNPIPPFGATEMQLQAFITQFQQVPGTFPVEEKRISRHRFSQEEDQRLRALVVQSGPSDWNLIAQHFHDRSARQCRDRWKHYLSPEVETGNWTQSEDDKLMAKVAELGSRWSQIALSFPSRTDIGIKNHYMSLKARQLRVSQPPRFEFPSIPGQTQQVLPPKPPDQSHQFPP